MTEQAYCSSIEIEMRVLDKTTEEAQDAASLGNPIVAYSTFPNLSALLQRQFVHTR
jgi:hypothetical protein